MVEIIQIFPKTKPSVNKSKTPLFATIGKIKAKKKVTGPKRILANINELTLTSNQNHTIIFAIYVSTSIKYKRQIVDINTA